MKIYLTGYLLILSLSLVAQSKKTDEQLIKDSRIESNNAIAKKDIDGLSKYWLPDFVQVRGNGTFLIGKDSIIKLWKDTFRANPQTSFIRIPSEIIINDGDPSMAWEKGTWEGINTYSKGGSYSAMWRKKDGAWKIQAELFVALH